MESNWKQTLMVSVITAVVASLINYFLWIRQFEATKKLALYEHKLSAIEKFSKDASTMIYYLRFMDKIHLQIVQAQNRFLPDSNTVNPFSDIKYKYKSLFSDKLTKEIVKKIKLKDTADYKNYEKANDFINQIYSTYWSTTNFFDGETLKKLEILRVSFQPDYYQFTVLALMKLNHANVGKIEDGDVDDDLLSKRHQQLEKVVQTMKNEVKWD